MSAALAQLTTANDLWQLPSNGKRRKGDTIEYPDVLPGFRCAVSELFE